MDDALAVLARFRQHDIPIWFHGGFALDALTGTVNDHGDVDAYCRYEDRHRIIACLRDNLVAIGPHGLVLNLNGAKLEIEWFWPWKNGFLISTSPTLIWRFGSDAFQHDRPAVLRDQELPVLHPKFVHMELTHLVWRKKRFYEKHKARGEMIARILSPEDLEESRKSWPTRNTLKNRMLTRLRIWPEDRRAKRKMHHCDN